MEDKTKYWHINTFRLFEGLSEEDKKTLGSMLTEENIDKKCFIYSEGDSDKFVYMLKEGKVKITKLSESGKELTVDILGSGDIFGELSMTGEDERRTSAETMENSYICKVTGDEFAKFLSSRPQFSFKITKWFGWRLQKIETRLQDMIFQDVPTRLITIIKDLSVRYGTPVGDSDKKKIKFSHQELANLIGATRETVTLELNNLKKDGKITMENREIII